MDIKLEKKPWYIRYRYYLAGAFLVCCGPVSYTHLRAHET